MPVPTAFAYADEAIEGRQTFEGMVREVREDERLTKLGKAEKIAELYEVATAALRDLKARYDEALAAERRVLRRRALGTGTEVGDSPELAVARLAGFRDAQERAARASTPGQLRALMDQAVLGDDRQLAQAALLRALDSASPFTGDSSGIAETYQENWPDGYAQLAELVDFETELASARGDILHPIRRAFVTLSEPPEVGQWRHAQAQAQPAPVTGFVAP